ncbi:MAG: hypothetical protein ACLP9L_17580, partial [Thermoguttaceae bacterium]
MQGDSGTIPRKIVLGSTFSPDLPVRRLAKLNPATNLLTIRLAMDGADGRREFSGRSENILLHLDLDRNFGRTVIRLTAQGWLPGAGQALPDGLSSAEFLQKVFNSHHVRLPPRTKLLGTIRTEVSGMVLPPF